MAQVPVIVRSKAGIKRDGTLYEGDYYVDGQWVRFQRGLPRKIGGYVTTNRFTSGISRGMIAFAQDDRTYISSGTANVLESTSMDMDGNTTELIDRTPSNATSFTVTSLVSATHATFPVNSDPSAAFARGTQLTLNSNPGVVYTVLSTTNTPANTITLTSPLQRDTVINEPVFYNLFTADASNAWQFDALVDTSMVPPNNQLIAQVAPNNQYVANTNGGQVFVGDLDGTSPLTPITATLNANYISASGGIVVIFPYLVVFGNAGSIGWSAPGKPRVFDSYTSSTYPAGFNTNTNTFAGVGAFSVEGNVTGLFSNGTRVALGSNAGPWYTVWRSVWDLGTPGNTTVFTYEYSSSVIPSGTAIFLQTQVLTGAGNARVANQKIVAGMPLRGGPGSSPSGLFWSLDSVIRMTFTGGDTVFSFDTISPDTSILSGQCVVEHDGIYYWTGSDRFLMFNGVVREIPNDLNINFFFDNLNRAYAGRVFGFKVPRYSEIWWCYPHGDSTECNHVVIYNIRENTWYDSKLPGKGRSAAVFLATFGRPLMGGVDPYQIPVNPGDTPSPIVYRLWLHESGHDEVDVTNVYSVHSYFETADFSLSAQEGGKLKSLRVSVIEPDFVQKGAMTVTITGSANARAQVVVGSPETFPAVALVSSDQVTFFKEQRRVLRFRFDSDVTGGDYQMGQVVAHIEETDGTYLGAIYD